VRPRLLLVLAVLTVVLAALAARTFVVRPLAVASGSMSPTICQGDWVFVDVWDHDIAGLSRGDLVAVRAPGAEGPLVKRVAGLPGDTVAINDALLYVNKQRVDEPYVDVAAIDALYYGPVVVPDDAILVLGDARASSVDSRAFGPVPGDGVIGRVLYHLSRGEC
jgi:signal peptidase I